VKDLTPAEKAVISREFAEFERLQRVHFLQGKKLIIKPTPEELLKISGYNYRKKVKHVSTSPRRKRSPQSGCSASGSD
jgi:hypothetical protein